MKIPEDFVESAEMIAEAKIRLQREHEDKCANNIKFLKERFEEECLKSINNGEDRFNLYVGWTGENPDRTGVLESLNDEFNHRGWYFYEASSSSERSSVCCQLGERGPVATDTEAKISRWESWGRPLCEGIIWIVCIAGFIALAYALGGTVE